MDNNKVLKNALFNKDFYILNKKYYLANAKYYNIDYLFCLYCGVWYYLKNQATNKKNLSIKENYIFIIQVFVIL